MLNCTSFGQLFNRDILLKYSPSVGMHRNVQLSKRRQEENKNQMHENDGVKRRPGCSESWEIDKKGKEAVLLRT